MSELSRHLCIVTLPLLLANVVHMAMVKRNYLSFASKPLWLWGFGKNKTWRGFIFVPVVNAIFVGSVNEILGLGTTRPLFLGLMLGIAYMLFELPNSYLKRRLDIPAGSTPQRNALLFNILDKTDSAFGVTLTYFLLGYTDLQMALVLFVINSLVHMVISQVLVMTRVKSSY